MSDPQPNVAAPKISFGLLSVMLVFGQVVAWLTILPSYDVFGSLLPFSLGDKPALGFPGSLMLWAPAVLAVVFGHLGSRKRNANMLLQGTGESGSGSVTPLRARLADDQNLAAIGAKAGKGLLGVAAGVVIAAVVVGFVVLMVVLAVVVALLSHM